MARCRWSNPDRGWGSPPRPNGLGEYASQLGFARVSWLAVSLAFASLDLFPHHRRPGAVHLHIEDWNRLSHQDGQIQLDGLLDLLLFSPCDIASDGLRRALYRFGRHFQAGQNLHLLAAVIEGILLTNSGWFRRSRRAQIW